MSRVKVDVIPLHVDDTECQHAVKSSGKPRDPDSGCTGRTGYLAVCRGEGCPWRYQAGLRRVVDDAARMHRGRCAAPPARGRRVSRAAGTAAADAGTILKGGS